MGWLPPAAGEELHIPEVAISPTCSHSHGDWGLQPAQELAATYTQTAREISFASCDVAPGARALQGASSTFF